MKCKNCNLLNEEDAIYCKRCGTLLEEQGNTNRKETKPKNQKTKVKRKTKTKIKKVKPMKKKNQPQKNNDGKNIFIVFLLIVVIALIGISLVMGYHIYDKDRNIEVPNLSQLSYDQASAVLASKNLKIEKKEKIVAEEGKNNIVLKQNKKEGTKVSKNTVIKVIVGKYQFSYIVENWIGKNIDEVKNELNHKGLLYQIEEKEIEEEKNHNKVIEQSPKKGTKINHSITVKITVGKYHQEIKEDNPEEDLEPEEDKDNDNEESQEKK